MRRARTTLIGVVAVTAGLLAAVMPPAQAAGTPKVVVIVLENKPYDKIVGSASAPYMNALMDEGRFFSDFHAIVRGSAPNYRAMTAGTTSNTSSPPDNIFRRIDQSPLRWVELNESMKSACGGKTTQTVPGTTEPLYTTGHDPSWMFRANESCAVNDLPLTSETQLGSLPDFTFLVPNQCDNMHTYAKTAPCPAYFGGVPGRDSVEIGDNWLAHVVPVLLRDPDVTVVITFDEGSDSSAQHIYTLAVGAGVPAGSVDGRRYDLYGLLAGLYDVFDLGTAPNQAATAAPLPIVTDVQRYDFTASVQGSGAVTSTPAGIACGSGQPGPCTASFGDGASVSLTPAADPGWVFSGWTGDCTGAGPCVVTMDRARSVTATFVTAQDLSVTVSGPGSVTSDPAGLDCPATSCTAGFADGSTVVLTATPTGDASFAGWTGDPACDGTSTPTCSLTADAARSVTATFVAASQHTLTVTPAGTGQGTVTSDVGGISCPPTCSTTLPDGQPVVLQAQPSSGSVFAGWSGEGCTGTSDCSIVMDGPKAVTATFDPEAPPDTAFDDDALAVTFNGWRGVADAAPNGGAYRVSGLTNDKAVWRSPTATSVTWVARVGPDAGIAKVLVDGTSKGTVDLYAASPGTLATTYGSLGSKAHNVVVKVTGGRNALSTGTAVSVDAFSAGSTLVQESDPRITYDLWQSVASASAYGGRYRWANASSASASIDFSGTSIDWITAVGPGFGKAAVTIDGVSMGQVDLYASSAVWQTPVTYGGLAPGPHTMLVRVLGTKNAASSSTKVVVDAFVSHG